MFARLMARTNININLTVIYISQQLSLTRIQHYGTCSYTCSHIFRRASSQSVVLPAISSSPAGATDLFPTNYFWNLYHLETAAAREVVRSL